MMKVVIDTSSLVSYFLTRGETMQRVMSAWMARQFDVYFCPVTYQEVAQVLRRPALATIAKFSPEELLAIIDGNGHMLPGTVVLTGVCRDPKDDIWLACAVEAQADYMVSSDRDLLDMRRHGETCIINPGAFLLALELYHLSAEQMVRRFGPAALREIAAAIPLDPTTMERLQQEIRR
jgi:putative PIN family toxin of toxin-antitoxin system